MSISIVRLARIVALGVLMSGWSSQPCRADEPVPIALAELAQGEPGKLALVSLVDAKDARQAEAARLLDNEGALFIRRLIARTLQRTKRVLPDGLLIVLERGGNHAVVGHRIQRGAKVEERPNEPHVRLELNKTRLSLTLLHEGGHVVHALVRGPARTSGWTPLPHSTFAVTEPATALSEGFASHLEALWGHFGKDAGRRAFYHHDAAPGVAEALHPVTDLLTYSQAFARYQSVRDGLPAFANAHAGSPTDYLRAQLDPERDRAVLKQPQALVSSEGVVASVLFWTVTRRALAHGAVAGGGLDQPALIDAEDDLVAALAAAESSPSPAAFRPDLVDLVAAPSTAREDLIDSYLAQTRGITARPTLSATWHVLWTAALTLDVPAVQREQQALTAALQEIGAVARKDAAILRTALGPVIPVRAPAVMMHVAAFGDPFPLELDLNGFTSAELSCLTKADAAFQEILRTERAKKSFDDVKDFEARTHRTLASLGLEAIKLER